VSVIYPGIDLGEYDAPGPPASIPGVGPEHKVVMYVGSIVHPNQGVPILIDALPRVFDAMPEARCVLVGGPADVGEAYRTQLGEHGDRLIVLTGQTPSQVVALTRRADVLVHSRLACRENYSGLLTPVESGALAGGILRVLGDPDLAARLAAATRPVAEEYFAMGRNIDRYLDVYRRAVAAGPR
jgi:glycosyltransferase involved in cell wall biosynthesis